MNWIDGDDAMYQPLPVPELGHWTVVRQCSDRASMMQRELKNCGQVATYLDVACSYGWFLAWAESFDLAATGIEVDPLAPVLAREAFGLDPKQIVVGDALSVLEKADSTWDVVSCFSLLHHFASENPALAQRLAASLGRVTERVLFLDTGSSLESWFSTNQALEEDAQVELVMEGGGFSRCERLGRDQDSQGRTDGNYGRMLVAFYP